MKKRTVLLLLGLCGLSLYVYSLYAKKSQQNREVFAGNLAEQPKMKKYCLNKLWRDKAASQLELHDGAIIHRRILHDDEYSFQLGLKAKEEIDEVIAAKNKQELTEEIGDVFEVLDCIIAFNNLDLQEIKTIQDNKRQTRGSYLAREFVTIAEAVPGSFLHQYYLKSPDRHQEIID